MKNNKSYFYISPLLSRKFAAKSSHYKELSPLHSLGFQPRGAVNTFHKR